MANRAYKFRIYPNDEQRILFAKTFGCVRMVYNYWLDRKIRQYEENKTNVTYTVCAKEMAAMKKTDEYAFLKEVDSVSLQQSLRHLDAAFQNFFRQPKAGFPKFKSKRSSVNCHGCRKAPKTETNSGSGLRSCTKKCLTNAKTSYISNQDR